MKTTFTVKDAKEIVKQLKAENNPILNDEIIKFYERKIADAVIKVSNKKLNACGLKFSVKLNRK